MKKRYWIFLLFGILNVCRPLHADDEPYERTMEFGLYGGEQAGNSNMQRSAAFMGSAGSTLSPHTAVDLRGGYMPAVSKMTFNGASVTNYRITSVEIVPKLMFSLGSVRPYLEAGLGYFIFGDSPSGDLVAAEAEANQSIVAQDGAGSSITYGLSMQQTIGGLVGAGLEIPVSSQVSLAFDLSYLYLRPRASVTQTQFDASNNETTSTASQSQLKMDAFRAMIGLKFRL